MSDHTLLQHLQPYAPRGGIPNSIEEILVEVCFRYLAHIVRHRSLLVVRQAEGFDRANQDASYLGFRQP